MMQRSTVDQPTRPKARRLFPQSGGVKVAGRFFVALRQPLKKDRSVTALRLGFCLRLLVLAVAGGARSGHAADEARPAPLTTAAAVRQLPPEEARRGLPVRLTGNLAIITVPRDALVLLDETDGIYVEVEQPVKKTLQLGDRLEIEGVTDPGDFAPIVRATRVALVGGGTLPAPRRTTIAELNAGGLDAAWVELEGIVRACVPTPRELMPVPRTPVGLAASASGENRGEESWMVTFNQGDDQLSVRISGRVAPADLVDARVRLRGVVFNVHNANRQFVRANLQLPSVAMIEVLAPPPADPFALPLQHVGEVLRFSPTGFTGHRVLVRGFVTGHRDRHTLWLREGDRGMRVASRQEGALSPGDEVEVVGFPDHGGYTPSLSDAVFRKIAEGPPPVPQVIRTAEEISRQDSNLVQIEAALTEVRRTAEGTVLTLAWNGMNVRARLLRGEDRVLGWEAGSRVRVAGICVLGQADFSPPSGLWVAGDMELWLRDAGDLVVLQAAPWLTTRRALFLVISVAILVLLALIIVAVLARRQIQQREKARQLAEVEFSAMLAERNRLAREIHDTLAQNLNAVSMQLELARNSARTGVVDAMMPHLGTAHQIVRTCLAEARESIWNMRSHVLERHDLIGALRTVAEQLSAGRDCRIQARAEGRARRLAPMIENNLLRIGQEAVANALKHARAGRIEIAIHFEAAAVRLVIEDDGAGFEPAGAPPDGDHFGLRGMRERVAQMSGRLTVGRGGRGGTRVEVVVDSVG